MIHELFTRVALVVFTLAVFTVEAHAASSLTPALRVEGAPKARSIRGLLVLDKRQSTCGNWINCGANHCCPTTAWSCCSDETCCDPGFYCVIGGGCCPDGEICTGPAPPPRHTTHIVTSTNTITIPRTPKPTPTPRPTPTPTPDPLPPTDTAPLPSLPSVSLSSPSFSLPTPSFDLPTGLPSTTTSASAVAGGSNAGTSAQTGSGLKIAPRGMIGTAATMIVSLIIIMAI